MRTLFIWCLNWGIIREMKGYGIPSTPTGLPTKTLNIPLDNTPLHALPTVWRPWGKDAAFDRYHFQKYSEPEQKTTHQDESRHL